MKRVPEHTQADDPALLRRLVRKPERQQVGSGVCQEEPRERGQGGKVLGTETRPWRVGIRDKVVSLFTSFLASSHKF